MNSLANMCYVCLEKKDKSLVNINSSLSVNEDIIHILGYLPFNLAWLKTKRIILICEECCRRLRETYQFLIMCNKNSAVLQGYMAKIITANISDAELRVDLDNKQDDIIKIKCEIKVDGEETNTVEKEQIIDETKYEFVNVDDSFVKEEDTWQVEAEDAEEEPPTANNDNGSNTKIPVNSDTDTDSDGSGFTSTQVHTTNTKRLNTAAKKPHKCPTCSKCFSRKTQLQRHTRVHTGEKPCKCATCEKCFSSNSDLMRHARLHTGERPYKCTRCKKCFVASSNLVYHMRTHTGEHPYECSVCQKCFSAQGTLVNHMRTHTGEKPYKCARCKKCFSWQSGLAYHTRMHTGEKPFECSACKKCFRNSSNLASHMRSHTGNEF